MTEYPREDWEAVAEFYEEFAATNRRLAKLFARKPDQISIVKQSEALAVEYEYHARKIRARIGAPIDIREDEKMKHMKVPMLLLIVLLALLLGTGVVVAQEATREPGELATQGVVPTQIVMTSVPVETVIAPEPTRVPVVIGEPIVLQPGSADNTWFIVTTIAVMLFTGLFMTIQQRNMGALLGSVERTLQDKRVQDEAERRYIQSSASFQDLIKFMHAAATYVGSKDLPGVDPMLDAAAGFLGAITDGKPNTGQALTAPKVPQYDNDALAARILGKTFDDDEGAG